MQQPQIPMDFCLYWENRVIFLLIVYGKQQVGISNYNPGYYIVMYDDIIEIVHSYPRYLFQVFKFS